ncbi:MAG TPA: protocatechuate 3,4-dioxygenase [Chloroflexota bacterium]|nr:protocatechuate 3,4-dioxygenase [Chloroflexota bacterium]
MAKVVLGIGSSHAPQLALPPEEWWRRAEADKNNPALWFHGKTYRFDELVEERAASHFEQELSPETAQHRFNTCQQSIEVLARTLEEVNPDVAVILGDDQEECFLEDNMPALCVYWGETIDTVPPPPNRIGGEYGASRPELSRYPAQRTANPCQPALGRHIIDCLIEEHFDPAHSRRLPGGKHGDHGVGHAFSYVYRRLMKDEVIPNVPIFLNTYYPPNQPTLKRCYALGKALRRAIESWEEDATVALIASGGLSHFVIEEDLDQNIVAALKAKDGDSLTSFPVEYFNSGTSEIRNWIVVAGALEETDLNMELIDYVPCYRSLAGTGCAMGFARWV